MQGVRMYNGTHGCVLVHTTQGGPRSCDATIHRAHPAGPALALCLAATGRTKVQRFGWCHDVRYPWGGVQAFMMAW
jgi:hypothetical protein